MLLSEVFLTVGLFTGIGVCITALEFLSLFSSRVYSRGGEFYWEVVKSIVPFGKRIPSLFMGARVVFFVFSVRAVAALYLVYAIIALASVSVWALSALLVTTLYVNYRHPYGLYGADHMSNILICALFFGFVFPGSPVAAQASAVFIAAQITLAYLTSGFSKLFSQSWRAGTPVFSVFNTASFGNEFVATLLYKRPTVTRLLSYGVIASWLVFPLVFFIPEPFNLGILFLTALLHIFIAVFMRINGFIWFFIGTYPAVVYVAHHIQSFLYF